MQGETTHATEIKSCYIGPHISPEQFVAEHFFLYLAKGSMEGYDGHKHYMLNAGEYCLVRKNHLARYTKHKDNGAFEKVVVVFDEAFLNTYKQKHNAVAAKPTLRSAFVPLTASPLVLNFIQSLRPYYNGAGKIEDVFADVKREELLLILLQGNPALAAIIFDTGAPAKMDLKAYMNRNYKFNVSVERFAYLTGRSLSAFKRDFKDVFGDTPSRWLVQRRLEEAHFLINKKAKRPSDIYLDLGFEDLSHFSFAFKKKYGLNPSGLA
jgi:AraC-like DNA-binding protein